MTMLARELVRALCSLAATHAGGNHVRGTMDTDSAAQNSQKLSPPFACLSF